MNKILLTGLSIFALLLGVFILPIFYPTGIAVYFRLFLLLLIFMGSLKLFKIIVIDHRHALPGEKNINQILSNAATVLFSVFILFIVLEAIFMFIPRSHSADFTLASRLWYAKYWKPVNSLGFRDQEPENDKPVIFFVGDSFTAGHGLKSVDERFSDIVGNELNKRGTKFTAINMGKPGLDSRSEYEAMKNFIYMTRIKPKAIVLQYYGNDIDAAAEDNGLIFGGFKPPPDMNRFLIFIGSGSYFFNYLYWSLPREYLGASYIKFLHQAYKNDAILSKHKDDLRLFVDYARENSVGLIVVVFPFLADIEMSDSMYVKDIVDFFESNKVSVINVSRLARNMPTSERIVNKNDIHASKKLNAIVAREILNRLDHHPGRTAGETVRQ